MFHNHRPGRDKFFCECWPAGMPDRPAYRGRRTPATSSGADSGPSDRRGDCRGGATPALPLGTRVGVSWIGGIDGTCWYCQQGLENLCDSPTFTGYTVNGGYAEYVIARADFVFPLPGALDDLHAAPLLWPVSLVFAVSGWLGWSTESEWASSVSGPRRISPSLSCARGDAKYMSQPGAPLIAGWRNRWAQPG